MKSPIATTVATIPAELVDLRRWVRNRSSIALPRMRVGFHESENVVRRAAKDLCERERQLQTRHIAPALDGIDALPRDADRLRQFFLRPPALAAQLFYSISDL